MSASAATPWRPTAVQEVVGLWALGFLGIILAFLAFGGSGIPKLVATVGFLYLPLIPMRWRGEDYRDYGLTPRHWRQDVRLFLGVSLIVFPLFFAAFALWTQVILPQLPGELARLLAPFRGPAHFTPRLPPQFAEWVVDQLFVVALPEEFFYRGYMQARLRDAWPQGRRFLGVRLGPAFWLTAVLFALGHLAIFQVWRLSVFFPALLFGWMRERTGSVVGAALFHAAANLFVRCLEASFFGV